VDLVLVFIYFSPRLIFYFYGAVDVVTGSFVGFGPFFSLSFAVLIYAGFFCADLAWFYFLVQTFGWICFILQFGCFAYIDIQVFG
jgi:hypothetical protein